MRNQHARELLRAALRHRSETATELILRAGAGIKLISVDASAFPNAVVRTVTPQEVVHVYNHNDDPADIRSGVERSRQTGAPGVRILTTGVGDG